MNNSHTPGPWYIREVDFRKTKYEIRGSKKNGEPLTIGIPPVAHIHNSERLKDDAYANARLIAAAPDIMSALQRMVSEHGRVTEETLQLAKNALSKACASC